MLNFLINIYIGIWIVGFIMWIIKLVIESIDDIARKSGQSTTTETTKNEKMTEYTYQTWE